MHYVFGPPIHEQNGDCIVRIGETAQKCVVFFGVETENAKIEYGGTGFLVTAFEGDNPQKFAYLVTARHVAELLKNHEDTGFYIRANLKGGGSQNLHIGGANWAFHADPNVDLAAVHFELHPGKYDHVRYMVTAKSIIDHEDPFSAHPGDVVSLVGLFRLHHGSKRSLPIVHTGNIALLPNKDERVPFRNPITRKLVESEVFLIEAQTLDGLSGSPAFMHKVVELKNYNPDGSIYPRAFSSGALLGLYIGSWDGEPGDILAKDRNFKGGARVPVGMGGVVPARKILELLNSPALSDGRKRTLEAMKDSRAAAMDSAIPMPSITPVPIDQVPIPPEQGDGNPNNKEDFTALLNAAVKKPKPGG